MANVKTVTNAIRYKLGLEIYEFIREYGLNRSSFYMTIKGERANENVLEALKLNDLLKFLPEKAKELIKKRNLKEYLV